MHLIIKFSQNHDEFANHELDAMQCKALHQYCELSFILKIACSLYNVISDNNGPFLFFMDIHVQHNTFKVVS